MSRRAPKEDGPVAGDEDGPPSDVAEDIEEEQPRAEVSDSEIESEGGDGNARDATRCARQPYIAWPR